MGSAHNAPTNYWLSKGPHVVAVVRKNVWLQRYMVTGSTFVGEILFSFALTVYLFVFFFFYRRSIFLRGGTYIVRAFTVRLVVNDSLFFRPDNVFNFVFRRNGSASVIKTKDNNPRIRSSIFYTDVGTTETTVLLLDAKSVTIIIVIILRVQKVTFERFEHFRFE